MPGGTLGLQVSEQLLFAHLVVEVVRVGVVLGRCRGVVEVSASLALPAECLAVEIVRACDLLFDLAVHTLRGAFLFVSYVLQVGEATAVVAHYSSSMALARCARCTSLSRLSAFSCMVLAKCAS